MPPTQPARPNPTGRPGATPPSVYPATPGEGGAAGEKPNLETTGYPQNPLSGPGAAGAQSNAPREGDFGTIATLQPADVWQLAFWSVTPSSSEDEAAHRRAEVRQILMSLVDEIAPAETQDVGGSRSSRFRR